MFKLAGDGVLRELLQAAGLIDVRVTPVSMERRFDTVDQYLAETLAMSSLFPLGYRELELDQQSRSNGGSSATPKPFTADDGSLALPGSSLVAVASA